MKPANSPAQQSPSEPSAGAGTALPPLREANGDGPSPPLPPDQPTMIQAPIPHPDLPRLTAENALLREELSRLLAEAEQWIQVVKPHLLALYQTRIGAWELRLLQAQCDAARLRREVELLQASLNRGQPPDRRAIAATLEREFVGWQEQVRTAAERVQAAQHHLAHPMAEADDREFKQLYRALVKRLHPDVNPRLTEGQQLLWRRVQTAYAAGALAELRALSLLAGESGPAEPPAQSLDTLRAAQATLRQQIATQLARLETIQSEPPFTLRAQLDDET
jgi:hypothetical protein